jgi:hypothetical protein
VILDRAARRDVEEFLRHEQRDESHHLQVGLERFELLPHLWVLVGSRLIDGKLRGERRLLEWISLRTRLLGRHIDRNHVLSALEQRFQNGLAERLLPVDYNTHFVLSELGTPVPALAGTTPSREEFHSAAAFFRAAVAPASLRPAISSAE